MSWTDILVIVVIGVFALLGLKKGLVLSVFGLASFFISAIAAIYLWPIVQKLINPLLFSTLKESISKGLPIRVPNLSAENSEAAASVVIDKLGLPGFLKPALLKAIPDPNKLIDTKTIINLISENLANIAIAIISMVLVFIIVRVALIFAKVILKDVSKLPIINQLDKVGGLGIGAFEGLLMVYIVFAVAMIFSSSQILKPFFEGINNSNFLAKTLYEHNYLVDWMLPKSGLL